MPRPKRANAHSRTADSTKRYIVVHRGPGDGVLQTSDPFTNEAEAGGHAEHLLRRINFFAGDKLCVEDEAGQAKEATNEG